MYSYNLSNQFSDIHLYVDVINYLNISFITDFACMPGLKRVIKSDYTSVLPCYTHVPQ